MWRASANVCSWQTGNLGAASTNGHRPPNTYQATACRARANITALDALHVAVEPRGFPPTEAYSSQPSRHLPTLRAGAIGENGDRAILRGGGAFGRASGRAGTGNGRAGERAGERVCGRIGVVNAAGGTAGGRALGRVGQRAGLLGGWTAVEQAGTRAGMRVGGRSDMRYMAQSIRRGRTSGRQVGVACGQVASTIKIAAFASACHASSARHRQIRRSGERASGCGARCPGGRAGGRASGRAGGKGVGGLLGGRASGGTRVLERLPALRTFPRGRATAPRVTAHEHMGWRTYQVQLGCLPRSRSLRACDC